MSGSSLAVEVARMTSSGYVETPTGRFYLRCNKALGEDAVRAQEQRHAEDPSEAVFRTCRRRWRHTGDCSPSWESNPKGVR